MPLDSPSTATLLVGLPFEDVVREFYCDAALTTSSSPLAYQIHRIWLASDVGVPIGLHFTCGAVFGDCADVEIRGAGSVTTRFLTQIRSIEVSQKKN